MLSNEFDQGVYNHIQDVSLMALKRIDNCVRLKSCHPTAKASRIWTVADANRNAYAVLIE
jgi:hypothetical protein